MISTYTELNQRAGRKRDMGKFLEQIWQVTTEHRKKITYNKILRSKHRGYINPTSEQPHFTPQQDNISTY